MKLKDGHIKVALELISFLFILLFVYAAVSKLLDFENFRVQLGQSPLLTAFADWVSWAVPLSEIVIAGMLLVPRLRLWGMYAAFALMVMFTSYIVIMLNFTDFIPCSCGGVLEKLGWTEHLVFNLFFVVLAAVGVLLLKMHERNQVMQYGLDRDFLIKRPLAKTVLLPMGFLALGGMALVVGLFLMSEEIVHKSNDFTRRYPPHPIKRTNELDLGFNSYYLAGAGEGKVYLGNTTAPLHLLAIDSTLRDTQHIRLLLGKKDLPFSALKVHVRPPYFFLTDGTVPALYVGSTEDWKAKMVKGSIPYFSLAEPMEKGYFALRTRARKQNQHVLGRLRMADTVDYQANPNLLIKQQDGIFSTDGLMIYNNNLNNLIFVHYYRNEYIVMDSLLRLQHRGKTIDTISQAQIQVVHITSKNSNTLGAPPLFVNKMIATVGPYLLINSKVPGKFESPEMWKEAAIIDVYDLEDHTYGFSFYLHYKNEHSPKQFLVHGKTLVSLLDRYLVSYHIRDRSFSKLKKEKRASIVVAPKLFKETTAQ